MKILFISKTIKDKTNIKELEYYNDIEFKNYDIIKKEIKNLRALALEYDLVVLHKPVLAIVSVLYIDYISLIKNEDSLEQIRGIVFYTKKKGFTDLDGDKVEFKY